MAATTMLMTQKYKIKNKGSCVWTREKIVELITLYQSHECLWNNYIESYKNKEKRNQAILLICTTLGICKFDFVKKIHNLRNQFNAEMKKLDKKMENSSNTPSIQRSRWEHYESLKFLKDVIAPRPGYSSLFKSSRQIEIKYSTEGGEDILAVTDQTDNAEELNGDSGCTDQDIERQLNNSTTITPKSTRHQDLNFTIDEFEEIPHGDISCDSKEKVHPIYIKKSNTQSPPLYNHQDQQKQQIATADESIPHDHQLAKNTQSTSTAQIQTSRLSIEQQIIGNKTILQGENVEHYRDQWDAFGELVASEFRNLNSDLSRKKLKRKMMQAMLEVGEEDDRLMMN